MDDFEDHRVRRLRGCMDPVPDPWAGIDAVVEEESESENGIVVQKVRVGGKWVFRNLGQRVRL